jgi:hypothetical protein
MRPIASPSRCPGSFGVLALIAAAHVAACTQSISVGDRAGATGGSGATGGASGTGGGGGPDAGGAGGLGTGGAGGPGTGGLGSGGAGGLGAGGAGGGGAGLTTASCTGTTLDRDATLDVDLHAVTLSGSVTVDGQPLPDGTVDRGKVLFISVIAHSGIVYLGTTGPASYSLRLPPGLYDIAYSSGGAACTADAVPVLPCGSATIRRAVPITADGKLDVDIPTAAVSGALTLRGAPFSGSAGDSPPQIDFVMDGGSYTVAGMATTAAGTTYRARLVAGRYDVRISGGGYFGRMARDLDLSSSRTLDLDIPGVRVTGRVSLDGGPLPGSATSDPAGILNIRQNGEIVTSASLTTTGGTTSFAFTALAGPTSIQFSPNQNLCSGVTGTLPAIPCATVELAAPDLATDADFDFALQTVVVSGQITLNGQPLPDAPAARGGVSFTSATATAPAPPLGSTGAGAYRLRLVAGTYDISFNGNPALCAAGAPATAMPCSRGTIARAVALTADRTLDLDLRSVRVSGNVTVRGAAMPAAGASRGTLTFLGQDGLVGVTTASLGASGPASYVVSLWPGMYRVTFDANQNLCGQGLPAPAVPCVGGLVPTTATLIGDGTLDVDVPAVTLTGKVTMNGAALPPEPGGRGALSFHQAPHNGLGEGSTQASVSLGTTGDGSYGVTLVPGPYIVAHGGTSSLCQPGQPLPMVPCLPQVVTGCP